jgi:DNA-binding transcriptional LysR family regulator
MDRLAAMEAFVRVIDTGSFSGAARQLHVGQPAVSKLIAQLEDRLGVRLVLRSTRGLSPTEAGQNFYERAKRAIEEADEADLAARGAGSALTGRLRIGLPVAFGRVAVIPHLAEFLAKHPALEMDLVMEDRSTDLIEEGIDVALRMGTLPDSGLTARRIGGCRRLVVGTPDYFARYGEPPTPEALVAHQVVMLMQPSVGPAVTFRRGGEAVTVHVGGRVRVTASEGVRAAVLAGLGLVVGSEWMFWAELENGTVHEVLQDWTLPSLDLWAIFPTGRRASAKAREFAGFMEGIMLRWCGRRGSNPHGLAAEGF